MKKKIIILLCGMMIAAMGIATAQNPNKKQRSGSMETILKDKSVCETTVQEGIHILTSPEWKQQSVTAHSPEKTLSNLFFENFEAAPVNGDFPEGWTNIGTPNGNSWTTMPLSNINGYSGTRYARIRYNETVPHNAWFITPNIAFTAGKNYTLTFRLQMEGFQNLREHLEVWVGNAPAAASMTDKLYDNTDNVAPWRKITLQFTAPETGNYHIGFHSLSPHYVNYTAIDDISVYETPDNDLVLEMISPRPYSHIPVTQTIIPSAKISNAGASTQTGITFSATLNDSPAGTSNPVATLLPNTVSELLTLSALPVASGSNTLVCTLLQAGTDADPSNNTATYLFQGTRNMYACDNIVELNGAGSSSPISLGQIFEITEPTVLSQVAVCFGNSAPIDYSISLYPMTGDMTVANTPLFTQEAVRNAMDFSFVDVPATDLTQGKYFLCVNQLSTVNISISYDSDLSKSAYIKDGTSLAVMSGYGALGIRMIMETDGCAEPSNLAVVPDYTSATFSWEGDAVRYEVTLNDGAQDHSFFTEHNSVIITGLTMGMSYTWSVKALCDAVHISSAVEGPLCTALGCNTANTAYPWSEGFEDAGSNFPFCWEQESVTGAIGWRVVEGEDEGAPFTAHGGTYKARINSNVKNVAKLVTPMLDISELEAPALKFWYTQRAAFGIRDSLAVYFKTSAEDEWTYLQSFRDVIQEWTEVTIMLPDKSDSYFIAFEGKTNGGQGVQLDDVLVVDMGNFVDAELAQITHPAAGLNLNLTDSEEVTVLIKNNGNNPLTGFLLNLELNGTAVASEVYTETIAGYEQAEYTFAATLDLSAEGNYEVNVSVVAADDETSENNSKSISITNVICAPLTSLAESFDGTVFPPACWTSYLVSGTSNWTRNTSTVHSGTGSAYQADASGQHETWLVTPELIIPSAGNYELKFWTFTRYPNYCEYSGVWISGDSGNPADSEFVEVKQLLKGTSDVTAQWQQITVPLNAFAGQNIRIGFKYKGNNAHAWYIDDVEVGGESAYTISASAGANGTITPDGNVTVAPGNSQTFAIAPNSGYKISQVLVDGVNSEEAVNSGSYTFINVMANHTIEASFTSETLPVYTIAASVGEGSGTINPSGNIPVAEGDSQLFTFTANSGYYVSQVLVDGVNSEEAVTDGQYAFTNVMENHTIEVSFAAQMHTIVASVNESNWGAITPSGNVQVVHGESQTFTVTPNTGYRIARVMIDGENNVDAIVSGSYTFANVTGNHTIEAEFAIEQYIINATAGENGTIAPSGGTVVVDHGNSQTFTMTPNTGYKISQVLVDGINNEDAVNSGSYTFTNVTANHTIHAEFTPVQYTVTLSVSPDEGGSVSGGNTYAHGESATITATPAVNYTFVNWTEDGIEVTDAEAEYTFTVTGNRTLVANFALQQFEVTFTVTNENGEPVEGASIVFNGETLAGYIASGVPAGEYNYTVSKTGYTTATGTVEVIDQNVTEEVTLGTVGIHDNTLTGIHLHPNPFTDEITVSNPAAVRNIQITDAAGQKVKEVALSSKTISTGELSSGVYFVTIEIVTGEKAVYKMVKK